mmetsp:Transcript_22070/g.40550  ORF Transcript_22070/g.40550 Transcript_22070/m.40550 type:complete len:271 (-) Transcript_22070:37-849(-)
MRVAARRLPKGCQAPQARWSWQPLRHIVTAEPKKPIKRFYDTASVHQVSDERWAVAIDGKPVKTPKGAPLELPTTALAEALAAEWRAQGEHVRPQDMPLNTLGCTAVDLIRPRMEACVERVLPFLATDTLCFEDSDSALAERQLDEWLPAREWFEAHFGVALDVARGRNLVVPEHPAETISTVEQDLLARDEWELSALEVATETAKSFIVAAALIERPDFTGEDALRWALLEEHFQIEKWGMVEGEHDISHSETLRWFEATQEFVRLRRQ